MYIVTGVIKW